MSSLVGAVMVIPFAAPFMALQTGTGEPNPTRSALTSMTGAAVESDFVHPEAQYVGKQNASLLSDAPLPPDVPRPQAALRIPYGGAVDVALARRAGEHAVRVLALEQSARRLSRKPGVRLFAGDVPRLMAISRAVHNFTQDITELSDSELRATAGWTQTRAEDGFLRELIHNGNSLESQSMAFGQLRRVNADVQRLLRDAAILRRENGDDEPQAQRVPPLLDRMDALWLYLKGPFPLDAVRLEELLIRDPGNPAYLLDYVELQLRTEQPTRALDTLKALNGIMDSSPQALYLRGLAQLALRLPALANKDFSRALDLAPEEPGYWQGRALTHAAMEDTEAMCADLEQACSLGLCDELEKSRTAGFCQKNKQSGLTNTRAE